MALFAIAIFSGAPNINSLILTVVGDTFHSMNSELRELPAVELSTLPLILKVRYAPFLNLALCALV